MLDPNRIKHAVENEGLAFPCAMCTHWWTAIDAGQPSCGKQMCGGPSRGRSFPDYKGPLPSGNWNHFCFVCGKPFDLSPIVAPGETRRLAVCKEHLKLIEDMIATPTGGGLAEPGRPIFVLGRPDHV